MIRLKYTPLMMRKVRSIVKKVERSRDKREEREEYARKLTGMTYRYLKEIGKKFESPSTRVLRNLGFELWIYDPESGESEQIDLETVCDWNPVNPQMRAASTRESAGSAKEKSTSSGWKRPTNPDTPTLHSFYETEAAKEL